MARFYFHLHDRLGHIPDLEGLELDDLAQVRSKAVEGARSIIKQDVADGRVDLTGRIEVTDADGAVVLILPFRHAVELEV